MGNVMMFGWWENSFDLILCKKFFVLLERVFNFFWNNFLIGLGKNIYALIKKCVIITKESFTYYVM
jgi:hypothetical protein